MAVCNPVTLPTQATCFHCIPPDAKAILNLVLLRSIASATATAAQLSAGAVTFRPLNGKLSLASKVYLLMVINGLTANSAAQMEALAKCWQCIPVSAREDVITYLYATAAGGSLDPATLTATIGPFKSLYFIRDQVELYLLNIVAGNLTLAQIMDGSKCLMCLDERRLEEIYIYLLCLGVGSGGGGGENIPLPPNYPPCPEVSFDLTVLADTVYIITWGANEVSVTLCGVVYDSTGAGTQTTVWTAGCTTMTFTTGLCGSAVTATVTKPSPGSKTPTPSGFTWVQNPAGTLAVATWDTPPLFVTSTELWTSSDDVTYVLATTVAAPGTTASVVAPTGLNTVKYAKVRWISTTSSPANGPFGSALRLFGAVADWAARVIVNGAAAMAQLTINAHETFFGTIFDAGTIIAKIKAMNTIAPDSVIAARSPLIVGVGIDPWTEISALSVNVDGVRCTFANGGMVTEVKPLIHFASVNEGGLACYVHTTENNDGGIDVDMGAFNAAGECCQLYTNFNGNPGSSFIQMFNNTTASVGVVTGNGAGYYSGNVNGGAVRLYGAKSTFPHAQLGGDGTPGGTRPNLAIFAMCLNSSGIATGSGTVRRYSFFCISTGFTSAEDNTMYNAVQALRIALGGGFV